MAQKKRKSLRHTNPALMKSIYWAIIIGIVAIFVIVTLESIGSILSEAFG
jgi:hypothetical protein